MGVNEDLQVSQLKHWLEARTGKEYTVLYHATTRQFEAVGQYGILRASGDLHDVKLAWEHALKRQGLVG